MTSGASGGIRERADRLIFGRDPRLSVRLLAVAGGLFVLMFLVHLPTRYVGPLALGIGFALPLLVGLATVAAAVGAYLNDGLLVSVALAGGVGYGFFFPLVIFDLAYPSETVLWALGTGAGFGVVSGVVGFVVGALARRVVARLRA